MFKTPITSIFCVLIAAFLGAIGQFLFKSATTTLKVGTLNFFLHPKIFTGILCYLSVMMLFTHAFKQGGSVMVLYPIYSSTFIWAAIIGRIIYKQQILPINVLGMGTLIVGMFFMGVKN